MAVTKVKKKEIISNLKNYLEQSKSIYFIKNNGIGVNSLNKLKKQLRESNTFFMIAKKTLIKLAFKDKYKDIDNQNDFFDGPIGIIFCTEDDISPIKIISNFQKENKGVLDFTGGIFDQNFIDKIQIIEISNIPSKEDLISKLVYMLKYPINTLHYNLSYNLKGLVSVLDKIKEQKS